jgi:uncharacterized membrane protein
MDTKEIDRLLKAETDQLAKLHTIVKQTLKDEELIVNKLLHPPQETLTRGQSLADKVARFGGSWAFIISFMLVLFVWILINISLPKGKSFDPFPFILLNLCLSCIAAIQAPVIMMSQNRQEEKDRQRAQNDYLVNLKAELEIRGFTGKLICLWKNS